ncbi:phosphate ABC transporter ATP-binding protein [Kribbella sancticallisti]|uniref:Phosphate ABC transporter ATP-binding protein n=1 Tax=Kribbella sancticallisti TaxID=460087 RepID=A0ABP4PEB0_9ACTN
MEQGFTFEEVVVERDGVRALDRFSADVPGSGVTAVFGPSGSGKTTLLRLCNRLEVPTAGRVLLRGSEVAGLDPLVLRRTVGMVFQRPTPFPGTVSDNLRAALPGATDQEMEQVLDRVALSGSWLDRDATALSGGEAQRVCLARTLIKQPRVLLLDEPTSAVDATAVELIERAVTELARDGLEVLWVTHDAEQVHRVADRVLRIDRGRCSGLAPVVRRADSGEVGQGEVGQ